MEGVVTFTRFVHATPFVENRRRTEQETLESKLQNKIRDYERCLQTSRGGGTTAEGNLQQWLRYASWSQCPQCFVWQQRSLTQGELIDPSRAQTKLIQICVSCRKQGVNRFMRSVADWPPPLLGLKKSANQLLRPVIIHQCNPVRHVHGYTRKTDFTALSWKAQPVHIEIETIHDDTERHEVLAAHAWLLEYSPAYSAYTQCHLRVLENAETLRLEPTSILEPYLECALWPTLYWSKALAESRHWDDGWITPFLQQARKNTDRESVKAEFTAKLTSAVGDYGLSLYFYDLLQFQVDRHILWLVTTRAAYGPKADLHLLFQGQHWSAEYWRKHHRCVVDISAQLGGPHLFVTIAPY